MHDHEASTSNIEEQIKARRILDACAEDGSRSLVYGVIREDNTAVRLPNTGVLHLPARIGTRKKGSKGWQQTLWYDMDWAQFDEFLERQTERHSADATKLFAMRGVRTLKEQYPDTASVGEAIRAAGLDPLNLDLEEMDMAS